MAAINGTLAEVIARVAQQRRRPRVMHLLDNPELITTIEQRLEIAGIPLRDGFEVVSHETAATLVLKSANPGYAGYVIKLTAPADRGILQHSTNNISFRGDPFIPAIQIEIPLNASAQHTHWQKRWDEEVGTQLQVRIEPMARSWHDIFPNLTVDTVQRSPHAEVLQDVHEQLGRQGLTANDLNINNVMYLPRSDAPPPQAIENMGDLTRHYHPVLMDMDGVKLVNTSAERRYTATPKNLEELDEVVARLGLEEEKTVVRIHEWSKSKSPVKQGPPD